MMKNISLTLKILISTSACLCLGALSGIATSSSITSWYLHINKPSFNPPNWVFGPAWTILYLFMGIAFALIWNVGIEKETVKKALRIFLIQFVLNLIWSVLFFTLQNPMIAFIDIVILLIAIGITIKHFLPLHKTAAYLLFPYLLWVSFATLLNGSIWYLN
jgi:translocator protein